MSRPWGILTSSRARASIPVNRKKSARRQSNFLTPIHVCRSSAKCVHTRLYTPSARCRVHCGRGRSKRLVRTSGSSSCSGPFRSLSIIPFYFYCHRFQFHNIPSLLAQRNQKKQGRKKEKRIREKELRALEPFGKKKEKKTTTTKIHVEGERDKYRGNGSSLQVCRLFMSFGLCYIQMVLRKFCARDRSTVA